MIYHDLPTEVYLCVVHNDRAYHRHTTIYATGVSSRRNAASQLKQVKAAVAEDLRRIKKIIAFAESGEVP
jgi:hypothetical protein